MTGPEIEYISNSYVRPVLRDENGLVVFVVLIQKLGVLRDDGRKFIV